MRMFFFFLIFIFFLLEGRVGLGEGELHSDQEDQGGTKQTVNSPSIAVSPFMEMVILSDGNSTSQNKVKSNHILLNVSTTTISLDIRLGGKKVICIFCINLTDIWKNINLICRITKYIISSGLSM